MAIAFKPLSWLRWRGKKIQEPKVFPSENPSELEMRELDTLKFPVSHIGNMKSSTRRVRNSWRSRVEKKIDKEHDAVLVPSDGGCVSGSESDDSDWSIGWLEPHGSGFQSNDSDNSFAVLVPCYGRGRGYQEDNSKNNHGRARGYQEDNLKTNHGRSRGYQEDNSKINYGRSRGYQEDNSKSNHGRSRGHQEDKWKSNHGRARGYQEDNWKSNHGHARGYQEDNWKSNYGPGRGYQEDNSKSKYPSNISDLYAADKMKFMEQWLSSQQIV